MDAGIQVVSTRILMLLWNDMNDINEMGGVMKYINIIEDYKIVIENYWNILEYVSKAIEHAWNIILCDLVCKYYASRWIWHWMTTAVKTVCKIISFEILVNLFEKFRCFNEIIWIKWLIWNNWMKWSYMVFLNGKI